MQIEQYLRVKILSYDKGNNAEKGARLVLTRTVEMLNA